MLNTQLLVQYGYCVGSEQMQRLLSCVSADQLGERTKLCLIACLCISTLDDFTCVWLLFLLHFPHKLKPTCYITLIIYCMHGIYVFVIDFALLCFIHVK